MWGYFNHSLILQSWTATAPLVPIALSPELCVLSSCSAILFLSMQTTTVGFMFNPVSPSVTLKLVCQLDWLGSYIGASKAHFCV